MKQNEAVRLALHILGGKSRLDKITLIALMLKDVDWSNAEEPDASIRRIVRHDEYIAPVEGQTAWYLLTKPIPDELISNDRLTDNWLERVTKYAKIKQKLEDMNSLLENVTAERDCFHEQLDQTLSSLINYIPLEKIVKHCLDNFDITKQSTIKLALYEILGDDITPEHRKIIEPLGKIDKSMPIQNFVYPQFGSTTNVGCDLGHLEIKNQFPSNTK